MILLLTQKMERPNCVLLGAAASVEGWEEATGDTTTGGLWSTSIDRSKRSINRSDSCSSFGNMKSLCMSSNLRLNSDQLSSELWDSVKSGRWENQSVKMWMISLHLSVSSCSLSDCESQQLSDVWRTVCLSELWGGRQLCWMDAEEEHE